MRWIVWMCLAGSVSLSWGEEWANPQKVAEVLAGTCSEAYVSWWGFDAEDSTRFLQNAIRSGARKLIVDRQDSPWVTSPLFCVSHQEIVLEEGTVILAKSGEFRGKGDSLFSIMGCENVTIRGEKAGSAATTFLRMRKSDYHAPPYEKAEWRHGINIKSSRNILIQDVTIEYTGGDGIYLGVSQRGKPCQDVTIRRVDCNANNRQGISVISAENLLIEDTLLRDTRGTAPEAGIDFEPNHASEVLKNCVMRNCISRGNAGDGYEFYLPNLTKDSEPISIRLENCVSENNRNGFHYISGVRPESETEPVRGTVEVKGFRTSREEEYGVRIRSNQIDSTFLRWEGLKISHPQKTPILFQASPADQRPVGWVDFQQVEIEDASPRPFLQYLDNSLRGWGLQKVSGTFVLKRDSRQETVVVDSPWLAKQYPTANLQNLPQLPISKDLQFVGATSPTLQPLPEVRLRHSGTFYFYARKGETAQIVLKQLPVGKNPPTPMQVTLQTPAGKEISLEELPLGMEKRYEIAISQTGLYQISAGRTSHAVTVRSSNVAVTFSAKPYAPLIGLPGTLTFWVPPGTKAWGLKVFGNGEERLKLTLLNPQGNVAFSRDNISTVTWFYPSEEELSQTGAWRLVVERPEKGVLEDYGIALEGIVPLLSPCADWRWTLPSAVAP
ncbi:MAG: right-handed parallel beta-helix repeat-containing protein [Planctomycetia bacterium]|nr:right-handed parallel beta-helix repeat-containing protein [Planctomycetia bacterium]